MSLYGWLVFALWLALAVYWVQASIRRRGVGDTWEWRREIALRLGFFALLLLSLRSAVALHVLPEMPGYLFNAGSIAGVLGLVMCTLGIGLAILGRAWLTRNRDSLVTSGPYAWVRHPIYAGMLLAVLGSAIAQSLLWILPLLLYGPAFVAGARREERCLSEQFPERYRAYMKRTRMLLPYVV